jgi:hypothetical protein
VNPRLPIAPTRATEKLSRLQEQELIAAAARVFRSGFPNPDRTGCPPERTLRATVRRERSVDRESILEHLTCCSPCFVEYEELLRRERTSKNLRILALCASLLITIGVAVWFYAFGGVPATRQPEPTIVQKEPKSSQAPLPEFEVAVIDLRNRAPVRGEQEPAANDNVVASVSPGRLNLTVYLPIGSEEGPYDIQILRDAQTPLVTLSGSATFQDRKIVLQLRTNLTGVQPGRYLIGVRKANFRWSYFPIALRP